MLDPNIKDFYERVGRLNEAHAQGFAFEAPGVFGRSHFRKPKQKSRMRLVLPVLFLVLAATGMKGAVHYAVGGPTYEGRVAQMQAGDSLSKLGAVLMAPDHLTLLISQGIHACLKKPD
jgi:hypothetical protein